jgi:hypothetical protein
MGQVLSAVHEKVPARNARNARNAIYRCTAMYRALWDSVLDWQTAGLVIFPKLVHLVIYLNYLCPISKVRLYKIIWYTTYPILIQLIKKYFVIHAIKDF